MTSTEIKEIINRELQVEPISILCFLTFQQLNILCDLNADKKYVKDCLQVIRYEDCIFINGIIMPRDHIASLHSFRFKMAKEAGNLNHDYLMDYKSELV